MNSSVVQDRHSELLEHFRPWTDPTSNETPPVVLVGAGLSWGLAPSADYLAREIALKRDAVEGAIGVQTSVNISCADDMYAWAGQCLAQKEEQGLTPTDAKKLLAEAMGLTTDARFLAQANVPLRGTTPRHRVLCRLAREGRVSALWSFNWDCWLEMSLESVGLRLGERRGSVIAPHGWKLRYLVWLDSMTSSTTTVDTLPVFKAHGCLRAISEGQGNFVISKEEMDREVDDQPPDRIARMSTQIEGKWTVTLGWSASEKYVRELIDRQGARGLLGEKLTIVDVDPQQDKHHNICQSYRCENPSAGLKVNPERPGNTDDLFLWIQTRRGFAALREASQIAMEQGMIGELEHSTPLFDDATFGEFWCVSFFDNWVPAWLKLCFLTGAQDHRIRPGHGTEILPPDLRDAHIPWGGADIPYRQDLQAAALLLAALATDSSPEKWDFETFPGALWDTREQTLTLPVPVWTNIDNVTSVGLRPLVESRHWSDKRRIRQLCLMPLSPMPATLDNTDVDARLQRWREALAALFGQAHLAVSEKLQTTELATLARNDSRPA